MPKTPITPHVRLLESVLGMVRLDILDGQARRQRLFELVSLFEILDAEGVQVLAAPNLKLHNILRLLDLDGCERDAGGASVRLSGMRLSAMGVQRDGSAARRECSTGG